MKPRLCIPQLRPLCWITSPPLVMQMELLDQVNLSFVSPWPTGGVFQVTLFSFWSSYCAQSKIGTFRFQKQNVWPLSHPHLLCKKRNGEQMLSYVNGITEQCNHTYRIRYCSRCAMREGGGHWAPWWSPCTLLTLWLSFYDIYNSAVFPRSLQWEQLEMKEKYRVSFMDGTQLPQRQKNNCQLHLS